MFWMRTTEESTTVTRSVFSHWRLFSQHSKIYSLARRTRYEFTRWVKKPYKADQEKWEIAKAFANAHPTYCQVFSDGQFKTVFTSEYRLLALDLDDPRIAEGLRISLRAIQRMHTCILKAVRVVQSPNVQTRNPGMTRSSGFSETGPTGQSTLK